MLLKILLAFLRTGLFGFGGGAAIAPAMYKEAVEKNRWVDSDTFSEIMALSNALPGPAAPQMAAIIGYRTAGLAGALIAVLSMIVPMAVFIVWVINWVFSAVGDSADKLLLLKKSTVAIFPLVAAMLCVLMAKFCRQASSSIGRGRTVLFSALCLALLALGVDNGFVILAMISLAVTAGTPWSPWVKAFTAALAGFFLVLHSSVPAALGLSFPRWFGGIPAVWLLLAGVRGLWVTPCAEGQGSRERPLLKAVLKDLSLLWALTAAAVVALMALSPVLRSSAFLGLMAWMALTGLAAFGGGPVFIPLAMGLLAGPGSRIFLYSRERLMQYIAIINALPSPIITKLSALAGWDAVHVLAAGAHTGGEMVPLGLTLRGSELTLWAAAAGAVLAAVMVLPAVTNALLAFSCMDGIKRSPAMAAVTRFILPVLTAIFLQVFLSFMATAFSTIAAMPGHTDLSAGLQCAGLFSLFLCLRSFRAGIPDPLLILGAVAYGVLVL